MADSIYTLDPVANNNTSLDSIPYGPNQLYHNQIDNLFRANASKIAQFVDDLGAVNTVGGTGDAITVTLASGITAYATGLIFSVKFGYTNTSTTVNLNVNSIGNKAVKVVSPVSGSLTDPPVGAIVAGNYGVFVYDGTYLVLTNPTAGGQYAFPATQNASSDANTLDDYEEGSFTPSFSAAGCTFSYAVQSGFYTKIGNTVFFQLLLQLNGSGNTIAANPLKIAGLPFAASSSFSFLVPTPTLWNGSPTAFVNLFGAVDSGATTISFVGSTAGIQGLYANTLPADAVLSTTGGSLISMRGSYQAAS